MRGRVAVSSAVAVVAAAVVTVHAASVSRQDADVLSKKLTAIVERGGTARPGSAAKPGATTVRRTTLSENELNSWFAYKAPQYLPAGVTRPTVTIIGNGAVKGAAVVDLDKVAKTRRGGGVLDPLSFLGGQLPVTVTGKLSTKDGQGRFEMQTAEIAGVPVPSALLEEVIAYYSRSSDPADRIRLGDAVALPANIRQIEVTPGQMVVVQ
jgi:hypothetical protein